LLSKDDADTRDPGRDKGEPLFSNDNMENETKLVARCKKDNGAHAGHAIKEKTVKCNSNGELHIVIYNFFTLIIIHGHQ